MRDWYSFKRIIARADIAPTSTPETFSIKARGSAEILELVSPSSSHPLTALALALAVALARTLT